MERKQKRWVQNILAFSLFFFVIAGFAGSDFTVKKVSAQEGAVVTTSQGSFTGIVPCGKREGPGSEPCTACHAIVGAKNVLDYLTRITVVVAIAIIFGMGVLYIISGVSVNLKKTAKEGLKAVFFGLVLMLSAWLIVSTLLRFLASDDIQSGGLAGLTVGQGVYGLQCSTGSSGNTVGQLGSGSSGGSGYKGTGICKPGSPVGNPCSPEALKNTCFGGASVSTWSAICQAESRGRVAAPSTVDKCTGDGSVVSFGLFQINISANKIGGLNCPSAFSSVYSGSNKNCRVINRSLYDQCVAAAKNPQQNIDTACRLAAPNVTNTGPWGAARSCNIPRKL